MKITCLYKRFLIITILLVSVFRYQLSAIGYQQSGEVAKNARVSAANIHVSVNGSDKNAGTPESPLASVSMALRKARELRRLKDPSIADGIVIRVAAGTYRLTESIFLRPEDAGTESSPTIIEGAGNSSTILSGGVPITGWKQVKQRLSGLPASSAGKVWVTSLPDVGAENFDFRQLWVNGRKAVRARERNADSMNRILSWNHAEETCWIPAPGAANLSAVKGVEMFIHQWWATAVLRIKKMEYAGDSVKLYFYQPESRIQSEHPWPAPWLSRKTGNSAFYLSNAIQLLDQPGEWYLDQEARRVYYYPLPGENMQTAETIAPFLEQLVQVNGTIDEPVSNIHFRSLAFMHTGWLRPSRLGLVGHQAGMFMTDAYKLKVPGTADKKGLENQAWVGRPAAAVEISYANHTSFEDCRFQHLGSTGLDYRRGTHDDIIRGNIFKDISGSGILAGVFSDEGFEIHRPYLPADMREVCTNELITNNLLTNVTNEDWGCVGIGAGYVKGINIEHNEVADVSYSAISMGWGWTRTINAMSNNRIYANRLHHYAKHMYDVSAIYTLSAQPGSQIIENYVDSIYLAPYAHDPHHWFYLYTDEGSSYFTVKNNWTPAQKFLQNANGPGNTWENNGPQVADSVKKQAGLQGKFQSLRSELTVSQGWPINHAEDATASQGQANPFAAVSKPVVLEIIGGEEGPVNPAVLKNLLSTEKVLLPFYQWKNHLVVFGPVSDTLAFREKLIAGYPGATIKVYGESFYLFDRSRCSPNTVATDWENIILTADLANDAKLQQEYLRYHANQFRDWPGVSKGFCTADFQQLIMFRQGRQLMLIISIPKGKTLDELNPKTTENNPRVDEWNNMMKKYQTGIKGTAPDEVWVFLKKI